MELIKIENGKVTSLELLKEINFFRKKDNVKNELAHKTLLGIIRDEFEEEINEQKFLPIFYKDSMNREKPMFILTISQAKQVLVRESKLVRKAVIKRLEELENKIIAPSYQITNPIERANAWIKEEKEKQVLLEQRKEDKPKVEFYDTVTGSSDTLDLGVVAKVINKKGYGRNRLFEFLRKKKILMQNNQPYQTYIDRGCFRTVESRFTKPNGDISINIKTVVYQKGVDLISKLLNENV